MLDIKTPLETKGSKVVRAPIVVTAIETSGIQMFLELPSPEEIRNLQENVSPFVSIGGITQKSVDDQRAFYSGEVERLQRKAPKFSNSPTFRAQLAELSKLSGDMREGLRVAKLSLHGTPAADDLHRYGSFLIDAGLMSDAYETFKACDLSKDVLALLRLGQLELLHNKDLDAASAFVNTAMQVDPLDFRTRMFRGALHVGHGRWQEAVRDFRTALEDNPNPGASLHVNLAAAYWGMNQTQKAVHALRNAVAVDPLNVHAVLFLADALRYLGRQEEALPALEYIAQYDNVNEHILSRIARHAYEAAMAKGKNGALLKTARGALQQWIALRETSAAWNDLGATEYFAGNRELAKRYFSQSIKVSKDEKSDVGLALSNLFVLQIENKDFDTVQAISSQYLNAHKHEGSASYAKIVIQHAICLEATGKRERGIAAIEAALTDNVGGLEARVEMLNQVVCHYSFVDPNAEKTRAYTQQLRDYMNDPTLHLAPSVVQRTTNNLVFAYLKMGDLRNADVFLPALSRVIGKDPYSTATLGLYHLIKSGDVARSESLYTRAVSKTHDRILKNRIRQRMHFEIAEYLAKHGDGAEAIRRYEKTLKLANGFDFVNEHAQQHLKQLKLIGSR